MLIVAFGCFVAALALGALVARRPPTSLDQLAIALRGRGVRAAIFFTALGRWWVIVPLGAIAVISALLLRSYESAPAFHATMMALVILLITQAVSQVTNALFKGAYRRQRPDAFIGIREPDKSYPSGHSVSAIVFFLGLAVLVWQAPLPRPLTVALVVALGICAVGIPWSRLALGAHYATDVIGGLLFGAAWLSALAAMANVIATGVR